MKRYNTKRTNIFLESKFFKCFGGKIKKGRTLLEESDALAKYYSNDNMKKRRKILQETLSTFGSARPSDFYKKIAMQNLHRWQEESNVAQSKAKVQVIQGDWGDTTLELSKKYGVCFAVLNMANAYVPGGGYVEGMSAQEENMFRRTDCHFYIDDNEYNRSKNLYHPQMTVLLEGKHGKVYLDTEHPRICIRGSEDTAKDSLGYPWLLEEEIFPFYELRASAQDLRGENDFSMDEARRRIAAQLDTLRDKGVKYAVLGAFGCGAFLNPPKIIAQLYKEEIDRRKDDFSLIAFAVRSSGHGYGNYEIFREILCQASPVAPAK